MKGYDSWKLSYPPEWDDPEPTEEQMEQAALYFFDLGIEASQSEILDKADSLMREAIEENKREAAEYQRESREDYDRGNW
jgi:hypothetical protein